MPRRLYHLQRAHSIACQHSAFMPHALACEHWSPMHQVVSKLCSWDSSPKQKYILRWTLRVAHLTGGRASHENRMESKEKDI
jgi:hypothetical protein